MIQAEWQAALARMQSEIVGVEETLKALVHSDVRIVDEVNRQTLAAGGKRLRPAFVLLVAQATGLGFDPGRLHRLAAVQEMIHMATLIHDDVIDHASTRRGRPTAASVFGNTAAILSGDVLLAKSMEVLAADGDLEIIRTVASSVVEMAEGEAREVETRMEFDLSEEDHLQILRMKTATFVECCCRVGALAAKAPSEHVDAYGRFGHYVGLAFQIIDDLLDYQGDELVTGKPVATDFREGCATLPVIYLREILTDEERDFAQNRFGAQPTDDEIRMICGWMETRQAYDRARSAAEEFAGLARAALRETPASPARDTLEAVVDFVLSRNN
jgi:octaprenyl-diphosphate synthase